MRKHPSTLGAILILAGALTVPTGPAQAAFPGRAGKIAFVSLRDDPAGGANCYELTTCNAEIYVMNADGTRQTRLTRDPAYDGDPVWSRDGRKIAYERSAPSPPGGTGTTFTLWVMNADGSGQHKIADYAQDAAWSPDGRRLVFQDSLYSCCDTLGVVNVDGSGRRLLTTASSPQDPDWSPDGTSIAYGASGPKIFTIHPDGRSKTFLNHYAFGPSWAPDGRQLAVSAYYSGSKRAIFVIDISSNRSRQVTDNAYRDQDPAWSPNGSSIAFDSLRAQKNPGACYPRCNSEIYAVGVDGSGLQRLTNNPAPDSAPDWQPLP